MKKIIFTGGGTGGHIIPNLALIDDLENYEIHYIGTNGMEKRILQDYKNVKFHEIPAVKFIRSFNLKNILIPFKLITSINKAKKILKDIKPNIIFSKGGYVAIPVTLAGNSLNIPVLTHESDLSVGLANKIIAKKSKFLCCSFEKTAKEFGKNAIFTGSPIRKKIKQGTKEKVLKTHFIKENLPIITIVGGSLGARAINEIIWQNIKELTKKYIVMHIVGKNNTKNDLKNLKNYYQIEFSNNIEDYFAASEVVITRAGSNTIFELLSIEKPMILIPLPKGVSRGDQILNAENFKEKGFASVIYQEELTFDSLKKIIDNTISKKNYYIGNMRKHKNYDGNKKIINLINSCAK